MSINGHDIDSSFRSGGRRNQDKGMPIPNIKNSKQRELEIGEFEGEEFGGEARAEEWSLGPRRGQTMGVIGVEMREEVGLAVIAPPVHRYQAFLHSSKRRRFRSQGLDCLQNADSEFVIGMERSARRLIFGLHFRGNVVFLFFFGF